MMRRIIFRRYAFTRKAANQMNGSSDAAKFAGSGSTASHGPRFKQYRFQDSTTKMGEDISLVEDRAGERAEKIPRMPW